MINMLRQTLHKVEEATTEWRVFIIGSITIVAIVGFAAGSHVAPRDITPDFATCSEPLYGNGELSVSYMTQLAIQKTMPGALNTADAVKRAEEHFGTGSLGAKEYITLCPADPLVEDDPLVATVNGVNVGKTGK